MLEMQLLKRNCEFLKVAQWSKWVNGTKGASIYDVCTEGGGGVSPKEDVVREVA